MKFRFAVFAAAIAAVSVPAFSGTASAREVCLQSARISGYNAVDARTLIVTDTSRNKFRVRVAGICQGLDSPRLAVALRSSSRLSCIGSGDRVAFRDYTFGRQSCSIRSVELIGAPRERNFDRRWDDRSGRYR
jgi:hypothetical protein